MSNKPLSGVRVISALNGLELFGHERANFQVFVSLRSMGAEVYVGVSAAEDNHVAKELERLGVSIFRLPFGPQWSIQWVRKKPSIAITNILAVFSCSFQFLREIRRFNPTHIHLGSPLAYSYISLSLLFNRRPLIYRMGDCPPVDSSFNFQIWRMLARRSIHIVANTVFVRESILQAGQDAGKVSVIYNMVPGNCRSVAQKDEVSVESFGKVNLLYVGQVARHKGLVELVDAIYQLAESYPEVHLHIVGGSRYDAPFRKELVQLIDHYGLGGRVTLHGYREDTSSFYRQASVHIVPSVWEEPGANVVLEAKQAGVPSVVFPSGGLPELVNHLKDGYVCQDKTASSLVKALSWMLEDTGRLEEMGKAALDDLDTRFGVERFQNEWAKIYESCTAGSV